MRTLKLQKLRERYAEPVAQPEPYLVTAEQLDAFVRQTVEQIVSVWQKEQKTNAPETGSNLIGKEEQA